MKHFEKPSLIFKRYAILKNIGFGSFGAVFEGKNIQTGEKVAIKIEERKGSKTLLEHEACILYYLKNPYLPEIKTFGKTQKYNILIQTLLGKSLYEIFNKCNKKFSIKDICNIGLQILDRLEYIHSKNYIHRDIKPHNFLMGNEYKDRIYMIDFGLSKKYRSARGNHVKFSVLKMITGTLRFCSLNAMRGIEQSRRDDLESFCYMIIYFFRGFLPWEGYKIGSIKDKFHAIANTKKNITVETLCENLPEEIKQLFRYVKGLEFTEDPKYNYMKNLFHSILKKNGLSNDNNFSWIKRSKNKINFINQNINKNSFFNKMSLQKRLYERTKDSSNKKNSEKKYKTINNDDNINILYLNKENISKEENHICHLYKINNLKKKQSKINYQPITPCNRKIRIVKTQSNLKNIDSSNKTDNKKMIIYHGRNIPNSCIRTNQNFTFLNIAKKSKNNINKDKKEKIINDLILEKKQKEKNSIVVDKNSNINIRKYINDSKKLSNNKIKNLKNFLNEQKQKHNNINENIIKNNNKSGIIKSNINNIIYIKNNEAKPNINQNFTIKKNNAKNGQYISRLNTEQSIHNTQYNLQNSEKTKNNTIDIYKVNFPNKNKIYTMNSHECLTRNKLYKNLRIKTSNQSKEKDNIYNLKNIISNRSNKNNYSLRLSLNNNFTYKSIFNNNEIIKKLEISSINRNNLYRPIYSTTESYIHKYNNKN